MVELLEIENLMKGIWKNIENINRENAMNLMNKLISTIAFEQAKYGWVLNELATSTEDKLKMNERVEK